MVSFKDVMLENEQILWTAPKNVGRIIVRSMIVVVFAIVLFHLFAGKDGQPCTINGIDTICNPVKYTPLVYIGAFVVACWSYYTNKTILYYITNKRIVIESGLIGRDFLSVYFDRILSADIDVGLLDKLFGTGTILIDTGKIVSTKNGARSTHDKISDIDDPYTVYKKVQETLSQYKDRPRDAAARADDAGSRLGSS